MGGEVAMGGAARRGGPSPLTRFLLGACGVAAFAGLAAGVTLSLMQGPGLRVPAAVARAQPQAIRLANAAELPPENFSITMLRAGAVAHTADGLAAEQMSGTALETAALAPDVYLARVSYRSQPAGDAVVEVRPGVMAVLRPDPAQLAAIEYRAGLAADARKSGSGIICFRRTVVLAPDHVDAHLQLAAWELLKGRPEEARAHLAAVRRVDPENADAAAVEKLLQQRP